MVLALTIGFVSVGTLGTLRIRQHFNPTLLLPSDTYLRQWIAARERNFPQVSHTVLTEKRPKDSLVCTIQADIEKVKIDPKHGNKGRKRKIKQKKFCKDFIKIKAKHG